MAPKARVFGNWASRGVGTVLLVAGLLKSTDLELFMTQIKAYQVIAHPLLLLISAWGLVAVQCILGTALLVSYQPKIALPATAGLWLILLGGTLWAAWSGVTDECGCYGAWLERSPRAAFVENLALLAATLYAWRSARAGIKPIRSGARWAVGTACVTGICLPLLFGVPLSAFVHPDRPATASSDRIQGLRIQGMPSLDLSNGQHLVVLMSTDCTHCLDSLPALDDLAETGGLPELTALCANTEPERKRFAEAFMPSFPLGGIDRESFWRLLSTGDMPRVLLVRDGEILHAWNAGAPSPDEIRRRLTALVRKGESTT